MFFEMRVHAEASHDLASTAMGLVAFPSVHLDERQDDVFQRGEMGKEIERLEEKSVFPSPETQGLLVLRHLRAVDADLAGIGLLETTEEAQQGRLAPARGADQGEHLHRVVERKIDPVGGAGRAIVFGQAPDLNAHSGSAARDGG